MYKPLILFFMNANFLAVSTFSTWLPFYMGFPPPFTILKMGRQREAVLLTKESYIVFSAKIMRQWRLFCLISTCHRSGLNLLSAVLFSILSVFSTDCGGEWTIVSAWFMIWRLRGQGLDFTEFLLASWGCCGYAPPSGHCILSSIAILAWTAELNRQLPI